ncbi:hypothetical protein BC826DRAFT_999063 [Russula brevipes]|nr:hypothetical protein BC826DRAFT_999063 [Russula brevipes]
MGTGVENESENPGKVKNRGNCDPWTQSIPVPFSPNPRPTDVSLSLAEEQRVRSSSGDMWPLYISQAEKHDPELVGRWKRQTDTTLNFAGLFSIVVSIFLVKAVGGLRPNQTELLLAQISLQLAQPGSPTFTPLPSDIAVNVLWTLSLALSITCALGATLIQEWIQEYLHYSQSHHIPSTRARIRAYLFDGLMIRALPLLLHVAVLLFGAGLITYLFPLNDLVAYTALVVYSTVGALYLLLTISPLISLSSPFKTPISNFLWRSVQLYRLTGLHIAQMTTTFSQFRLPKLISACRERYRGGIERALEQDLETRHPNTDAHSLRWAILSMQSDNALESFIAAIPQFLDSERHSYPQYTIGQLLEDRDVRLGWSIGRLLQTCASASCALEPHVRKGRAIACMRATWCITEKFAGTSTLFWDTLFGAETANSLSTLRNDMDPSIALIAQCTAALAARSCLRELTEVSTWAQTKGPYWANRAQHIAGYIDTLSGITLPSEPEVLARDGPLLILSAFFTALPFGVAEADAVSTTVKHLADGVRAGEATQDAQRQFSGIFSPGTYYILRRYLDPAASRAVRHTVASLHQGLATRIPEDCGAAGADTDFASDGRCYSEGWSFGLSGTPFSGDAGSSPRLEPCH